MVASPCRKRRANGKSAESRRRNEARRPPACAGESKKIRWLREGSGVIATSYHDPVNLVVDPPVLPMLAKRVEELPTEKGWLFEPKWDGFRALVFRDGDELFVQSRDQKPLNRYFPDLLEPLLASLPRRCVVDGEIVIAKDNALDFDELQLRLHPAATRVQTLAKQNPASMVLFDLLCHDAVDLCGEPFHVRRKTLTKLLGKVGAPINSRPLRPTSTRLAIGSNVSKVQVWMASSRSGRMVCMNPTSA